MSPYYFSSIPDEMKRTGWQWVDKHPRMETPPVWEPLEREVDDSIQPIEWAVFALAVVLAVLASAVWPMGWFQ